MQFQPPRARAVNGGISWLEKLLANRTIAAARSVISTMVSQPRALGGESGVAHQSPNSGIGGGMSLSSFVVPAISYRRDDQGAPSQLWPCLHGARSVVLGSACGVRCEMPDSLGGRDLSSARLTSDPRNSRSITEDSIHPPTQVGQYAALNARLLRFVAAPVMNATMDDGHQDEAGRDMESRSKTRRIADCCGAYYVWLRHNWGWRELESQSSRQKGIESCLDSVLRWRSQCRLLHVVSSQNH